MCILWMKAISLGTSTSHVQTCRLWPQEMGEMASRKSDWMFKSIAILSLRKNGGVDSRNSQTPSWRRDWMDRGAFKHVVTFARRASGETFHARGSSSTMTTATRVRCAECRDTRGAVGAPPGCEKVAWTSSAKSMAGNGTTAHPTMAAPSSLNNRNDPWTSYPRKLDGNVIGAAFRRQRYTRRRRGIDRVKFQRM